ncbi:serine hydrolase [Streptomyces bambusae]|uniref:serine hydrolase n=1 Tax=Streptomyces bambusae TaxID=1550616 RepID=UPI001CFFF851|nr:serine hydrolase [Streptomyces bambusae]MCB5169888.1 serine hydrolase [Streptomyces bambusae]
MRLRRSRLLAATGLAVLLAAGAVPGAGAAEPSPPPEPWPLLTEADVQKALDRLDGYVADTMRSTGIPGMSVAVVYRDKVVYLKGFGVRKAGEPAKVGPDTVFQLASVSKPLSSTVVAGAVADGGVRWGDPVAKHLPGFTLKDPWVGEHVTVADLFSHRSGLPDHAGDLLEDLGYDQQYILQHLKYEALDPFRTSYAYTNFGLTAAAEAVAAAKGVTWQKLSEDVLFRPAGMTATSTTFEDYAKAADRAYGHVRTADGSWQAREVRDADAQAPAGGASSTAEDMAKWLRLQLAAGKLGGKQVVDGEELLHTHQPQITSSPSRTPVARTGFYGFGWNVSYDDQGRLRLSHTGAFDLGANTNVTMLPAEELGIVVLTNAAPTGVPDAVALDFFDTAQYGKPRTDWLALAASLYTQQLSLGDEPSPTNYASPPADAKAAQDDAAYLGTYENEFYGRLEVVEGADGGLVLLLGPEPERYPLTHYDGNTFSFLTRGENAVGRTGVTFKDGAVRVEYLDQTGLGTFTKAGGQPSAG